jgi:hypothetical protein
MNLIKTPKTKWATEVSEFEMKKPGKKKPDPKKPDVKNPGQKTPNKKK